MDYILNRRSGVLHKLPASESCNTDQVLQKERFFIHASEEVVGHLEQEEFRRCKRCFRAD